MDSQAIRYTELPHTSRLFTDYLYDGARVREFLPSLPGAGGDLASFQSAASAIRYSDDVRRQVVSVLREQNQRWGASDITIQNLKRLEKPGCAAVVTGQQVGLFTGPAFALYKALTAIKLADHLTKQGLEAVPIFWLATEDHDREEVDHCFVQDRDGNPQKVEYTAASPVENAPVGSIAFDESIAAVVESLRSLLPDTAGDSGWFDAVAESYRPGETFGAAFGRFIARTLGRFGVIQVDPLEPRLHALSRHVLRAAIESADTLQQRLRERDHRLVEAGYHAQVRVADSSTLLFLNVDGQRTPLRLSPAGLTANGRSYSAPELLRQLEDRPEMFSPNVLLRPVMQDALLPTIAYVAGPSELAYMAQASVVYTEVLGRVPLLLSRASFTVLDPASKRLMQKYSVSLSDIYAGKQPLRDKMAVRFMPPDLAELFQKTGSQLDQNLDAIRDALAQLDPTLVDAAQNSGRKMQYQLSSLEQKTSAAIRSRSDQVERDAVRLENALYPIKTMQERCYSGVSFLARYGSDFLNHIYEHIPILPSEHQVISL